MRILMTFVIALLPMSAFADAVCDELWLTRNTVFDRANYCFGSQLGKAIFDNSDCTTSAPKLSAEDERVIAQVREAERDMGCQVDTNRRVLDLDYVGQRRALHDLPVVTGYESACLDYRGPALLLTAGRHPDTAIFGEIFPGEDIPLTHMSADGMEFLDMGDGRMGWVASQFITPALCTAGVAG